jgi:hypothetical protein
VEGWTRQGTGKRRRKGPEQGQGCRLECMVKGEWLRRHCSTNHISTSSNIGNPIVMWEGSSGRLRSLQRGGVPLLQEQGMQGVGNSSREGISTGHLGKTRGRQHVSKAGLGPQQAV